MKLKTLIIVISIVALVIVSSWICYVHFQRSQLREELLKRFSKLRAEYQKKRAQGYDVSEVERWIEKARDAFEKGDYETASEMLDKAIEALKRAKKIPQFPFPVVKSNSWITDPITLYDFVPFGVTLVKLPDNRIVIDRKKGWIASNFVQFGMAVDDEHILIFHSSVNIGGSHFRLMFGRLENNTFSGKRMYMFLRGASYYDEGGKYFPYPTVYSNPKNDYVLTIAYDEKTRTWYHKILYTKSSPPVEILYIEGRGRLAPLWVGKPEGPFVVHGIAGIRGGKLCLDTWGGYLDFEEVKVIRYYDMESNKTYTFSKGFAFMDREYHRLLPLGEVKIKEGKIVDGVEFDAMSFHKVDGEEIEFIFILARNPLPPELKKKFEFPEFERIGRINFVSRGESYRLDEYIFWTDGKLQPEMYFLKGNITDESGKVVGKVDLKARAFAYWGRRGTENWGVGRPWWDPEGRVAWGRSFVKWSGTITLRDEIIRVEDVLGFGEFHRYRGKYMSSSPYDSSSSTPLFIKTGTIEYIPIEGGFYGIVTDTGEKYLPLNLPEEYKVDGLRVEFKARIKRGVITIYMWGTPVEIIEIRRLVSTIPEEVRKEALERLAKVKVAIHYRYITDGGVINRTIDDVIRIFKETGADFVFQAWITQSPCPDKCSDLPPDEAWKYEIRGYSYEHLRNAVSKIKEELPDIILCGGTQAEFLYPEEVRGSSEEERRDRAWNMSLDPRKWGINVSRGEVQCYWARRWGFIDKDEECPSEEELKWRMDFYFPDLTNPEFQEILLSRIYRQIDCGVDAIWIDMLYGQAYLLLGLTGDWNHPAVQESYEAAWRIVEKIREYGFKTKNRYIYVLSWVGAIRGDEVYTVPSTNLDIGAVSPTANEVRNAITGEIAQFNEELWDELVKEVEENLKIPLFAILDYGGPGRTVLHVFTQELTPEEAREFLRRADEFFTERGIVFVYPVHGGDMGRLGVEVTKLSYGRFNWYDSLAPEFQTYETIVKLAEKRGV